jgi:hypothetical protein
MRKIVFLKNAKIINEININLLKIIFNDQAAKLILILSKYFFSI